MGDPYNNPYAHHYHHQVKANVSANGASQDFSYNLNNYGTKASNHGVMGGAMSGLVGAQDPSPSSHLNSLNDCVNRLQTSLNQYLTKIIDEGSEGPSNYQLGSGEVLNSHLMEQYADGRGPGSDGGHGGGVGGGGPHVGGGIHGPGPNTASSFANPDPNNGYSYYSNYPQNYPNYHHPTAHPQQSPYGLPPTAYSHHQYPEFQEPKPKKQKSK